MSEDDIQNMVVAWLYNLDLNILYSSGKQRRASHDNLYLLVTKTALDYLNPTLERLENASEEARKNDRYFIMLSFDPPSESDPKHKKREGRITFIKNLISLANASILNVYRSRGIFDGGMSVANIKNLKTSPQFEYVLLNAWIDTLELDAKDFQETNGQRSGAGQKAIDKNYAAASSAWRGRWARSRPFPTALTRAEKDQLVRRTDEVLSQSYIIANSTVELLLKQTRKILLQ